MPMALPGQIFFGSPTSCIFCGVKFLQNDSVEAHRGERLAHLHLDDVFLPVVIVEQARVKAAGVEKNRLAPRAFDFVGGDEIIRRVHHHAAHVMMDIGVNEPEFSVRMRQARRPDAAGILAAAHVELRHTVERAAKQPPVRQIARVMDLHAGKPLKGGGGNVIIVPDAADGRVGIKTGENWILDVRACIISFRRRCWSRSRFTSKMVSPARLCFGGGVSRLTT